MKPVSTGTGLIVLSATIAACFAASRFGGEERALAQEVNHSQPDSPRSQQQLMAGGPVGNCAPISEAWFSPIPRAISYECIRVPRDSLYAADVNRDGITDYFYSDVSDVSLVENGSPASNRDIALFHSKMIASGAGSVHTHSYIFPNLSEVGSHLLSQYPTLRLASVVSNAGYDAQTRMGWRDMDSDGDLDLVVSISMTFNGSSDNAAQPFWFENIGFQASPPPNPYDLDHSGSVNIADLSLLLMEFTD